MQIEESLGNNLNPTQQVNTVFTICVDEHTNSVHQPDTRAIQHTDLVRDQNIVCEQIHELVNSGHDRTNLGHERMNSGHERLINVKEQEDINYEQRHISQEQRDYIQSQTIDQINTKHEQMNTCLVQNSLADQDINKQLNHSQQIKTEFKQPSPFNAQTGAYLEENKPVFTFDRQCSNQQSYEQTFMEQTNIGTDEQAYLGHTNIENNEQLYRIGEMKPVGKIFNINNIRCVCTLHESETKKEKEGGKKMEGK